MRSYSEIKRWVQAAEADGWKRKAATGMFTGKKPRGSAGKHWPKEYFYLIKDGFEVMVWYGREARYSSLHFYFPNGTRHELEYLNQENGYNYENLLLAQKQCPQCRKETNQLIVFGLNKICQDCIDLTTDFSKKNPQPKQKEPIGSFKLEFRHVHGKRSVDKVKNYRILAKIDSPELSTCWEPYDGTNHEVADEISWTLQHTMQILNYKIEYSEVHTDWTGTVISKVR